ncbi:MAG: family peptidase [Frankiales bacterium]|nr:family peptidase [Frankiales bacterium]
MPQHASPLRPSLRRAALLVAGAAALTACQGATGTARTAAVAQADAPIAAAGAQTPSPAPLPALTAPRLRPDVLVTVTKPMTAKEVHDVAILAPGAVVFATGAVRVNGKAVHVASVSPANFRRFAAKGTAESTPVWQAVADGGVIASHAAARSLQLALGKDVLVGGKKWLTLRLGALATTGIPDTDLVVDSATGAKLGLKGATAVLLNAGKADPISLASRVRKVTGGGAHVDLLTAPAANPVAFLTGSKAARAFGAFSYTYFPDGTIQPDVAWVRANIVTASVPILGTVTCHRLMFPQLRGALQAVKDAGLASTIHSYNGCYVPRFIERNPSHPISLHTWGIAIDLDASTNGRGTKGTMDPRVVQIFKQWGFRWGGDWSYTDPMHFEIGALLNQ